MSHLESEHGNSNGPIAEISCLQTLENARFSPRIGQINVMAKVWLTMNNHRLPIRLESGFNEETASR
jgi:hypothetical protein